VAFEPPENIGGRRLERFLGGVLKTLRGSSRDKSCGCDGGYVDQMRAALATAARTLAFSLSAPLKLHMCQLDLEFREEADEK